MKLRHLLECTIDITQPVPEIVAVINAILAAQPSPDAQLAILTALDSEIGTALAGLQREGGEA